LHKAEGTSFKNEPTEASNKKRETVKSLANEFTKLNIYQELDHIVIEEREANTETDFVRIRNKN